jgi:hypothetical protein
MKKLIVFLFGFMVMCIAQDNWARDLRGGVAVSGMGGASYAMGTGFLSEDNIKNNYGFGVSVEYFFMKTLSGGLSLVHNSFQGYWSESHYHFGNYHYSTDWNWTNVSIFGKFVLGPEDKLSPYLKGGVGLHIPRTKDGWYYHLIQLTPIHLMEMDNLVGILGWGFNIW